MGHVIWTNPALIDVAEIRDFIARDSVRYADQTSERLVQSTRGLARSPRSGGRVPEFDAETLREIIVRPYRVIYEIRDDACVVLAVIHGSRDLPRAFRWSGESDGN